MKLFLWMLLGLALAVQSQAAVQTYYVRPGSAGDGGSWSSAYPALPKALERGSIYYLAAGAYPSHSFRDLGALPITIKKATESDHGANEGWKQEYSSGPAVFPALEFSSSHYLIDGRTGGGAGSWTSGHGIRIIIADPEKNGVTLAPGVSDIVFRSIEITQKGDTKIDLSPNAAFYNGDSSAFDLSFDRLYIHHLSGLAFYLGQGSRILIENSYLGDLCGVSRANADQHCEHLVARGLDDLTVRNSILTGAESSGALVVNDGGDGSPSRNWLIYGNVFSDSRAVPIVNNGVLAENWRIFNNTFTGSGEIVLGSQKGSMIYNNLFDSPGHLYGLETAAHDYNTYANPPRDCSNPEATQFEIGYSAHENGENGRCSGGIDAVVYVPPAQFRNPAGSDYRLKAPLSGFRGQSGGGLNICQLPGIDCAREKYDFDVWGVKRGRDGVWDRGAYELDLDAEPVKTLRPLPGCTDLKTDLSIGMGENAGLNGDVRRLQNFLAGSYDPGISLTGYFNRQTKSAVMSFQRTFMNSSAAKGNVGPATRSMIKNATCR